LEARLVGLLRSHAGDDIAEIACPTRADVPPCAGTAVVSVSMAGRAVTGGENLSVNDRRGPVSTTVAAGKFAFHQTFAVRAARVRRLLPCETASADEPTKGEGEGGGEVGRADER
jgi:hypothetical protein